VPPSPTRRYSLFALVGLAGEDDLDAPDLKRVPRDPSATGERRPRPTLAASVSPRQRRTATGLRACGSLPLRDQVILERYGRRRDARFHPHHRPARGSGACRQRGRPRCAPRFWCARTAIARIVARARSSVSSCSITALPPVFVTPRRTPTILIASPPSAGAAMSARTPQDLKAIARTKRLALDHHDFVVRQRSKVPGGRAPSRRPVEQFERSMTRPQPAPRRAF